MKNSIWIFAAAATLALLTGRPALAATDTWSGNTDTDWNTASNWSSGLPVTGATGTTLIFGTAGTSGASLSNTLTSSAFNINGITFNSGGDAFTFGGNTFTLTASITNSGTNTQTFNNTGGLFNSVASTFTVSPSGGIIITGGLTDSSNANQTTTVNGAGGTLTLGSFTLNSGAGSFTDTLNGSGNINITGAITNGGAGANAFTYSGTGTLTIGGVTSYTGASIFSSGTTNLTGTMNTTGNVAVNNAAAIFNQSSTGAIAGTGTFTVSNGAVNLAGKNSYTGFTLVTGGVLTLSGTLANSGIVVSNAAGTFNETSTGVIAGTTGSFTVSAGTATLAGSNTMSGGVKVSGGTLNIANANALGAGTFTLTGGTIDNTTGAAATLAGISAQSWGGSFSFTGTNALDLGSSAVTMTAASTVTVNSATNALEEDGAIGGAFGLTKSGIGTLILTGNNSYSGSTTVSTSGGILWIKGASGAIASTSSITIGSGGELLVDDRGAGNLNNNRVSNGAITLGNRASFVYEGTDDASAGNNSLETVGTVSSSGIGVITVVSNSSLWGAKLSLGGFTHTATTGGIALVNGTNLGSGALGGNIPQVILNSAPTLVGTTAANPTGINNSVQNTKIIPYLLGESGMGTGQNGTMTGTANTFVTYNATTGIRPLNPTDEYTGVVSGTVTNGNNIYVSSNSALTASGTINSLVINGGDISVADSQTLTDSSGALLFVTSNTIKPSGTTGGLIFGNSEGIVTTDAGVNATISANISGTGSLTVYGGANSTLTLSGSNSFSGNLGVGTGATLVVGSNNALGTGSITYSAGGLIQADNQARTISNTFSVSGGGGAATGIGGSNNITLTGAPTTGIAVALNANSTAEFTVANTATTTITGTFSLYNNSSSSYNNNGEGVTVGTSSNLVITGPVVDNNSGNVSSGAGSILTLTFKGTGGNITLNPTLANNTYGGTFANGFTVTGFGLGYNTFTLGGPGGAGATITPFGLTNYSNNGAGSFLVAANNGQIIANNWVAGGSVNNVAFSLGFAGTNSITLSGTFQNPSTFLNIADPSATLTFAGVQSLGNFSIFNLDGSGNTSYSATSTLTGTTITKVGSGTLTISGTNNMIGNSNFSGGTLILDYSTNNNNKLAQSTTVSGTSVSLSGVNVQLNGGSYAQTLSAGSGTVLSGSGQSSISQTGGGTSTLALGAITRAANGGSALNIGGTGNFVSTTSTGANGILGGYATVNGSDWAVGGGSISALSTYGSFAVAGTGTTRNILQTDGTSVTGTTVNSLKIATTTTGQQMAITGALALTSGGLLFTGSNDYSITGGTIQATSNTTDLVLQQYGTGTLTISSVIGGGTNALTKAGTGTVILTGTNTYTGTTFVDQGVLKISADNNLGSGGSITLNGGTLDVTTAGFTSTRSMALGANGGTLEVDAGTLTMSGVLSGGLGVGGITKTGAGTLVLSGVNTFLAPVTVTAGTLQLANASALGASSTNSNRSAAPILVNGGNLDIGGQITALGNITLSSGSISDSVGTGSLTGYSFNLQSGTVGAALIDDAITGAQGTSIDLYKSTAGTVILTGANTYSGATQISAGTLQVGNGGGTGTLGSANVTMTGGALAFNRNNAYTVANAVTGTGAVSQIGSGTTSLTNSNSYSGGTTVSAGTLVAANTTGSATGSGALTVGTGGTLAGAGIINSTTNTINGAVQAGFVGTATNTTGNLTLLSSSTTTFSGASMNLQFNLSATTLGQGTEINVGSSSIAFGGVGTGMTLTFNLIGSGTANITDGTQYILFAGTGTSQYSGLVTDSNNHITNFNIVMTGNSLGGGTNQSYYSGSYLMLVGSNIDLVVAVPEPGTWVLMLGGLVLLVAFQRIRRSKNN